MKYHRSPTSKYSQPVRTTRGKTYITVVITAVLFILAAVFAFPQYASKIGIPTDSFNNPFKLGLDLQGGTHLVYEADMAGVQDGDELNALSGVKDVIERRVNAFGVSEPIVQTTTTGGSYRVIIELAGVLDSNEAIKLIGETPILEFKEYSEEALAEANEQPTEFIVQTNEAGETEIVQADGATEGIAEIELPSPWVNTELSGRHLSRANIQFDQTSGQPYVSITFNSEGDKLFGEITERLVGQPLAIFLDGEIISMPTVQEAIYGGTAVITGQFTVDEAKILSQRLNAGALPVPLNLMSQQTVGPTLGQISLEKSIIAALIGFALVGLYMVVYYRLAGLFAVCALIMYAAFNLAVYKALDVTITLAGIAGFILSVGMAVDANVLIFERFREELASGRDVLGAIDEGFRRAWTSIRDGNITTLIAAAVLFWFSTSFIKGFALTLSVGILLSMFTAITVTRVWLRLIAGWKWAQNKRLYGHHR
ncbi:MAG: protein translocase subunit SecD [Candidatus Uhrbacteria bacterium]